MYDFTIIKSTKLAVYIRRIADILVILGVLLVLSCMPGAAREDTFPQSNLEKIEITSPDFIQENSKLVIPTKFTCDGEDISPTLKWKGVPPKAQSLVLIMDDPDAPGHISPWSHWVMFNIPATQIGLPQALPRTIRLPNGAVQGVNDFKEHGYRGPCPPNGTHRYYFHLYALDIRLNLTPNATRDAVLKAMKGHVIAYGELVANYSR